jgi:hypothetical protein
MRDFTYSYVCVFSLCPDAEAETVGYDDFIECEVGLYKLNSVDP